MDVIGNLLSVSVYEGLAYAFVALGVYITFRVLAFPDLTVDGSFPLGSAVTAVLIINGTNPGWPLSWRFFPGPAPVLSQRY